jgi:hypothetical protein
MAAFGNLIRNGGVDCGSTASDEEPKIAVQTTSSRASTGPCHDSGGTTKTPVGPRRQSEGRVPPG